MSVGPITRWPISANDELHDTSRMAGRAPPHASPPKFLIGTLVCGGTYCVRTGKTGCSLVTFPDCSPVLPVTILNVEPGGYRSWYWWASSGLPGVSPMSALLISSCLGAAWEMRFG